MITIVFANVPTDIHLSPDCFGQFSESVADIMGVDKCQIETYITQNHVFLVNSAGLVYPNDMFVEIQGNNLPEEQSKAVTACVFEFVRGMKLEQTPFVLFSNCRG